MNYMAADYKLVAKIHKYWSRKPGSIIRNFIEEFSNVSDLVFDPFCGSGTIGIEAIANSRNFLGFDLNPFAIFLTENSLSTEFESELFEMELKHLIDQVKKPIMKLYKWEDKFILFTNQGIKSKTEYNAMVSDENFGNRTRTTIPDKYIKSTIENVDLKDLDFPDRPFPKEFYKDRFSYKGVKNVSDLFTKRNLIALSLLFSAVKNGKYRHQKLFMLAFTNTLLHVSKLKSESIRPLGVNNYWIPDDYIEENVIWRFMDRVQNVGIAKRELKKYIESSGSLYSNYTLENRSSINLNGVQTDSVEYIFTDPPYGDVIQYSELSYVWNTWLEFEFKIEDELIVNPVQSKDNKFFLLKLEKFLVEAHRVLKPQGKFTLCFQNKDVNLWFDVAELCYQCGFDLVRLDTFDYQGSPFNKNWSAKSPKLDFYLTMNKNPQRTYTEHSESEVNLMDKFRSYESDNWSELVNEFINLGIREIFQGKRIVRHKKKSLNQYFTDLISARLQDHEKDKHLRLF